MYIEKVKDEEFFEFAEYVGLEPNTKRGVLRRKQTAKGEGYVILFCKRNDSSVQLQNAISGLLGLSTISGRYSNASMVLGFTDTVCKDSDENGLDYSEQWQEFLERKNIAQRTDIKIHNDDYSK